MKLKLYLQIVIFILLTMSYTEKKCFAGAWTPDAGTAYHKISVNAYQADEEFDNNTDTMEFEENGKYRDYNLSYYLEYGFNDRLAFLFSWAYKQLKYNNNFSKSKTNGLSDIDLGAKIKLFNLKGGVFSAQGLIKIPEAYDEPEADNENKSVPLGNGQYDFEARLLYGQSLYPMIPGYLNFEAAYRKRNESPEDEFRYLVEAGINFTEQIYCRIKLDEIVGLGNADTVNGNKGNPSATDDYDLRKIDASAGLKFLPHWCVEAGYRDEIYGKNTSSGANWSLAIIYLQE